MVTDLDTAGSCPDPATHQHPSSKAPTLMDLPMDVIKEIAKHIGNSLCHFALAHPRFTAIFTKLRRYRMRIDHICENLQRSAAANFQDMRFLILMNCHSESSLILSLILKCPHLTELNTVNSGLTTPDLVQCINFLSELETLKCSVPGGPDDAQKAPLPDNHSIKSIYVEHSEWAFVFLLKFINSCLKIERLHLVQLPYERLPDAIDDLGDGQVDPPISRERWQTLQTVILAEFLSENSERLFLSVFQNCSASSNVTFADFSPETETVYDRGYFNVEAPRQPIVDESPLLSRTYCVDSGDPVWHYGQPRQLKIGDNREWSPSGSLPESLASLTTLVELDIGECHTENRPHIWDPLFQASAGLKSLIVPLCLLTICFGDKRGNEVFPFVEALEKLKLKRLCCFDLNCGSTHNKCHYSPSLPCLTGLTHLEELSLMGPPGGGDLWSRIAIRGLSCLRIYQGPKEHLNLSGLNSFFETCKKLRYLKLDWYNLPLHEELLWQHLSHASLKQLCIASWSPEPVDLDMVRRYLPRLCESLDVLHVHAQHVGNVDELSSLLTAGIARINLTREHNPVLSIPANSRSHNVDEIVANFAGRALCCPRFEPKLELLGWDIN